MISHTSFNGHGRESTVRNSQEKKKSTALNIFLHEFEKFKALHEQEKRMGWLWRVRPGY